MFFSLGLLSSSLFVSAQLRVIDNKGTISVVDESKWTRIGATNDIFNKFPGNVGIGTSSPVAALHNAGSTLYGTLALTNFAANGAIGTAAATVDIYTSINIQQTTVGITLTIPVPTNTTAGRILQVSNTGTSPVTVIATLIGTSQTAEFVYNGTAWTNPAAGAASSVPFNGLTNATAINTVDNTTLAQTWGWTSATTQNPLTLNANALTTGTLLGLNANALTSGTALAVTSSGTGTTGNMLHVQSASTSAFTNGGVSFNFSGAHAGSGFQIDDVTTTGAVQSINATGVYTGAGLWNLNANAATTGTVANINTNALTSGMALALTGTGTGTTGNLFHVQSASTSAFANGGVRFIFSGAHTGNGFQLDDATTTGNAMQINANAITTGSGLNITSSSALNTSTNGLLRVANTTATTTGTVFRAQSNSTAGTGLTVLANNKVGAGTDTPNTTLDVNGDVALRMGAITAVTGNNNNIVIGNRSFIRITGPAGNFTITGIAGGYDGKMVILYNATATRMALSNESTSSTAANRINTLGNTINTTAAGGSSVTLIYDATSSRWIVTSLMN